MVFHLHKCRNSATYRRQRQQVGEISDAKKWLKASETGKWRWIRKYRTQIKKRSWRNQMSLELGKEERNYEKKVSLDYKKEWKIF